LNPELEEKLEGATIDYIDGGAFGGTFEVRRESEASVPQGRLNFGDPTVKKIHELLKSEINPAIAMHGGFAELVDVKDNVVYLRLAGGCQGCGMAAVTLRNGIELRIKEECPEIVGIVDSTDHAGGTNPYFQAAR
ncbi:MAG: NifU family protein, partial [bacterium]